MSAELIFISFALSLGSNVILLMGSTAFFHWLGDTVQNRYVVKHRHGIVLISSFVWILFVAFQSWANMYLGPKAFGLHWTFLNVTLISIYLLNLAGKNWGETSILAGFVIFYFLGYATAYKWPAYIMLALILFMLYEGKKHADEIVSHRWYLYTGIDIFALAFITMVYNMAPSYHLDIWFWIRQFVAFTVLSGSTIEFNLVLYGMKWRTEKLTHQATIDELTGLRNFGSFNTMLAKRFGEFQKDGSNYSVFEFDIDRFKNINDTFGHPAGNKVLRTFSVALSKFLNNQDVVGQVYRIGGEEFGIIARGDLSMADATQIARDLRVMVSELRFPDVDPDLRITISLGQDCASPIDSSPLDVYTAADQNLYASKRAGRNRMTLHGQLVEE